MGWVARTAHANVLPGAYTLLMEAGQAYRDRPIAALCGDVDVSVLARVLGSNELEVTDRRAGAAAAAGFVVLDGVPLRLADLATATRRVSPKTLARTGVHFMSTMVRTVPFCPESWELVTDRCTACARIQRWRPAVDATRCDRCGDDLTRQSIPTVPKHLRAHLRHVAALVGRNRDRRTDALARLPDALRHLSCGEALELTVTIAGILDPTLPAIRPAHADPARDLAYIRLLAKAWTAIVGFPDTLRRSVREMAYAQNGTARAQRRQLVSAISARRRAGTLAAVDAVLRSVVEVQEIDDVSTSREHVRVEPAGWLLGASAAEVAHGRDAGLLRSTTVLCGGRLLKTIDAAEVRHLAAIRRDRVSDDAAGTELGLPAYGIRHMVEQGLLPADNHPWLLARYGHPIVTRDAIQALRSGMRAAASPQDEKDSMDLATLMRGYGGGPKPWCDVARLLWNGDIEFHVAPGEIRFNRIRVPRESASVLFALPAREASETYSQRDALELLNLRHANTYGLARYRTTPGKTSAWRLNGRAILSVARATATAAELVARTGIHSRTVQIRLDKAGVPRAHDLGWVRADAYRLLNIPLF